jgi:hypothetical protein
VISDDMIHENYFDENVLTYEENEQDQRIME